MFVVGFLAWATSGGSFNLTGMLQDTVTRSVPITLGAIAGILCERSGIINLAIEGQDIAFGEGVVLLVLAKQAIESQVANRRTHFRR